MAYARASLPGGGSGYSRRIFYAIPLFFLQKIYTKYLKLSFKSGNLFTMNLKNTKFYGILSKICQKPPILIKNRKL